MQFALDLLAFLDWLGDWSVSIMLVSLAVFSVGLLAYAFGVLSQDDPKDEQCLSSVGMLGFFMFWLGLMAFMFGIGLWACFPPDQGVVI